MKVLITGGTGLLGKALIDAADEHVEIFATYLGDYRPPDPARAAYRRLDIRDSDGYGRLFDEFMPDVVIHTAGVGSPDQAEKHKEETWQINIGGIRNIIAQSEKHGARFIYISSNGIYDGDGAPYGEDDAARPINYYGQVKLEGEKITAGAKVPTAVVRPILMYGWNHSFERPNIATFALSRLSKGEDVHAYDDVFVNPMFVGSCAEGIWRLIDTKRYGTYNFAGRDRVSVHELVRKVAIMFGYDPDLVVPVQQGFFNELVKRPKDTSYDTGKMESVLGVKPLGLDEGLRLMKVAQKDDRGKK